MKAKDFVLCILGLFSILFLWLFLTEKGKARKKDELIKKLTKENSALKMHYLDPLLKFLETQNKVGPHVINELRRLMKEIDTIETEVHLELKEVIKLLMEDKGTKAVRELAKIVEYKLKQKIERDSAVKPKIMLHDLLKQAFECSWINKRQHENGLLLKEIRNKESHELAVQEDSLNIGMAIFAGIDIIYTINKIEPEFVGYTIEQ